MNCLFQNVSFLIVLMSAPITYPSNCLLSIKELIFTCLNRLARFCTSQFKPTAQNACKLITKMCIDVNMCDIFSSHEPKAHRL